MFLQIGGHRIENYIKFVVYLDSVTSSLTHMGKCPRCGGESARYGVVALKVGRTRSIFSIINVCAKCNLVFYEWTKEKPRFV